MGFNLWKEENSSSLPPRPKKSYSKILPLAEGKTATEQFGWLPVSIFRPGRGKGWEEAVQDEGDVSTRRSKSAKYLPGLRFSKFNAHLAEVVVRYWSVRGDLIVDPFAGRATRGTVALRLGRRYQGYEVAPTTYKETAHKIEELGGELEFADGCILRHSKDDSAGLIFTCPPYWKLEKYESAKYQLSDSPSYSKFLHLISYCAANCYRVLHPGRFLCWVCADWRDGGGLTLFHADSLKIFRKAGFKVHDIVIVENLSPFAALQIGKVAAKRYTSKVHEYLLVFRKE